ncbi:MAG: VCBS repeat-containing protein [Planctomycetota bacterium]
MRSAHAAFGSLFVCTLLTTAAHGETTYHDASADMLPMAMTQGRSMDAEWADLNNDGRPDLIVASEFGQNIVLITPADGDRTRAHNALPQGQMNDSEDIAIADVNGDDHLDIIFVAEDDQTNELYLGDGAGKFTDASDRLPSPGGISNAVLALDIDDDGDTDFILGNAGVNIVLINDGAGNFTDDDSRVPRQTDTTQDIEAGDVDGDGDIDLFIANEEQNRIWINDGRGMFSDATDERLAHAGIRETREIDLFDADGDGDLDAFLANVGWRPMTNPSNVLLLNDGAGNFAPAPDDALPASGAFTLDADAHDIDGDGDADLVLANVNGPSVQVWVNDGSGVFADSTMDALPMMKVTNGIDVEVIDLDGDDVAEIYLANHVGADRVLKRR